MFFFMYIKIIYMLSHKSIITLGVYNQNRIVCFITNHTTQIQLTRIRHQQLPFVGHRLDAQRDFVFCLRAHRFVCRLGLWAGAVCCTRSIAIAMRDGDAPNYCSGFMGRAKIVHQPAVGHNTVYSRFAQKSTNMQDR